MGQRKVKGLGPTKAAKLLEVDRSLLHYWEKQGWLVRFDDASIDVDATRAQVAANADPGKSKTAASAGGRRQADARTRGGSRTAADAEAALAAIAGIPEGLTVNDARLAKEYWASELNRMKAETQKGELVDLETVIREWRTVVRAMRSRIQATPQRMVDALLSAGLASPDAHRTELETVLAAEVDKALTALADKAPGLE